MATAVLLGAAVAVSGVAAGAKGDGRHKVASGNRHGTAVGNVGPNAGLNVCGNSVAAFGKSGHAWCKAKQHNSSKGKAKVRNGHDKRWDGKCSHDRKGRKGRDDRRHDDFKGFGAHGDDDRKGHKWHKGRKGRDDRCDKRGRKGRDKDWDKHRHKDWDKHGDKGRGKGDRPSNSWFSDNHLGAAIGNVAPNVGLNLCGNSVAVAGKSGHAGCKTKQHNSSKGWAGVDND
jgi:hypothetical protein